MRSSFVLVDHTMLNPAFLLLQKCYVCGGVRIKIASDNHGRKRGFRIPVPQKADTKPSCFALVDHTMLNPEIALCAISKVCAQ